MNTLVTQLTYPGLDGIISATAETSQGIQPGRVTVTLPASTLGTLDPIGDLAFSDGNAAILWKNCRVASVGYAGGAGYPPTATVMFEDRRWQWGLSQISGRYNVPAEYTNTVAIVATANNPSIGNQPVGQVPIPPNELPIRPETAKTARELCVLCLKAMGETTWDITAIDPAAYPSVEWDYEVPARALQALAERFGCRVVYRYDTDDVLIAKQGQGGPLPDAPFLFDSPSLTPKPVPKRIIVSSAFIKYQMRFALEAVGMEFDGSWRPIGDLSYAPDKGWSSQGNGPPTFAGLYGRSGFPGKRNVWDAIALASAYVYRAYRIKLTAANGSGVLRIPADGGEADRVDYLKQVYLLPVKAQVTVDDFGRHSPAPAQCFGRHTPPHGRGLGDPTLFYDQTTATTEVLSPFSVDPEHAIILFADYVYAFKPTDGNYHPAEIVLETACHFAPKDTWQFRRRDFTLNVPGGLADLPSYSVHEELFATSVASYQDNFGFATLLAGPVKNNDADLQGRANYYLAGELLKLVPTAAETRKYSGVLPVTLDGAVGQLTVDFRAGDKNTPATTASLNTEHSVYQPTYQGRRLREEADLRPQAREADRQAAQMRADRGDGAGGVT